VLACAVSVRAGGPIAPGDDIFSTPCGGGTHDYEPIPAGFFTSTSGSVSKVYIDGIELGGVPLAINPPINPSADVDTVVRRLAGTSAGFACGASETVPIEIKALSLTSCAPIAVQYEDGTSEDWDVSVCLSPTQTLGSMTINHECQDGGSYMATLPVTVDITFDRVGGGAGSPLIMSGRTLTFDSFGWWLHDGSGFSLSRLDPGAQFDADCNGLTATDPTTVNNAAADFFPGMFMFGCDSCTLAVATGEPCCEPLPQPGCGNPDCEECVCSLAPHCCLNQWDSLCVQIAQDNCPEVCKCLPPPGPDKRKPGLNPEQARLAAHGLPVANPGKLSGGGGPVPSEACCKPDNPLGLDCIDVTPADCVNLYHGLPQGPGTKCATLICNPPPYENWVIADDFMLSCADCTCDINRDGLCDLADLAFQTDCVNNNGGPGCDRADLDCDGAWNSNDTNIWQCLFGGGGPACCPPARRPKINRIRWYGSYFDPEFEAGLRDIDAWLIGLHSDVPPQACPPPPPGTKPVDLCGTLDVCSDDPSFWVFTPKGSSFQYNLVDLNSNLTGANPGDMVRICGYLDETLTSPCVQGIDRIGVQDVLDCDSKVSRPDRLIAQWAVDPQTVQRDDTGKVGWDGHRIYCYTADLPDACLEHNFSTADEIDPLGRICPLNNRTYWLSIQASVGHLITKDPATGECVETPTNQPPIERDYWGWHTTPPGYQQKDDAYMGSLHMAVDPNDPEGCERSWVYHWMSHLHCSDPKYRDCCDDPTKSIDMAFYLIDADGHCGNGDPCDVDADCSDGSTCVQSELVRWCQPVNPGPPSSPWPPIRPLPYGGIDEFLQTSALLVVNVPGGAPSGDQITMTGPTVVSRGIEHEDIGIIDTEIIEMQLTGFSPDLGPMELRLNPSQPSVGQSLKQPGNYQVDSFFDIWVEVHLGGTGQVLESVGPVRVEAVHYEIPPGRTSFQGPVGGSVDLRDRDSNLIVGSIKFVDHFVPYRGGVNIHSDIDWPASPMDDCCEPNADGSACEPVVCPDPNQECVPTAQVCQCALTCSGSGAPCATDANCPAGETCQLNGTCVCVITDCDCRGPVPVCHAIDVPGQFPPVECVDPCPDPALSCERFGFDTDGDGKDDEWRCDCDPVNDPTGLCCDQAGNCFISTQSGCPVPPNLSFHAGASCTGPEACCIPGGATDFCLMIEPRCCVDMGGTPLLGQVCTAQEACCLPGGTCLDMDPVCCVNAGGSPGGAGSLCQGNEACCFQDGSCAYLDPICCVQQGGTPQGPGTDCTDPNICQEAECQPDPNGPGCVGDCPDPAIEECLPRCVRINPATGAVEATDCNCINPEECHVASSAIGGGAGGGRGVNVAGPSGNPCVVADNGGGTVTLPPAGCEYLSPDEVHEIIDGLPAGTTIEFGTIHKDFMCRKQNAVCSFPPGVDCEESGGTLGGAKECSGSLLALDLNGTGTLAGYQRNLMLPIDFETHTGPRSPGDPVQTFDTDMFRLFGQIMGDPDFDLLRFTAGTDFGLPSPGHTTLTQLPSGDWAVDSFFDITYRIDFVGAPGGPLAGMSGSTTGTIRMTTGAGDTRCEGVCPPGAECKETRIVNADGTVDLCCECIEPECGPNDTQTACVGNCADNTQVCAPQCVVVDPVTGVITVEECACIDPEACHVDLDGTGGRGVNVAGTGGNPCVVTDNGGGTVTLPPAGCEYLSPDEVHEIIDGLPAGTTIEFGTIHKDFMCRKQNAVCSFPPGVDCEDSGGSLGGAKECSSSVLDMDLNGTGSLAGYQRTIVLPIDFETHTAPRNPGDPVQSFDTDMFRLRGELFGDPDFDLLRIVAGTDFGMPSPGHTTLTQLPGGDWAVDSFFDITYRIDFVGAPGGPLAGMSGSTTGTIRMATGSQPACVGSCPAGEVCVRDEIVNADGTISLCCRCEPAECEPAPGGQSCTNIVCPNPGEECVPQQIKCDALGCRVTVCDCQQPTNCHVEMPPAGTDTPVCVGGCPLTPPNQRCILFRKDLDGDGLPQEYFCRCVRKPPVIVVGPIGTLKNRYLAFELSPSPLRGSGEDARNDRKGSLASKSGIAARAGAPSEAIRIKAADLPQFPGMNGAIWWAGPAAEICEDSSSSGSPPSCTQGSFTTSPTQCDPHFADWSGVGVLHVRGPDVVPGPSEYIVQVVDSSCEDLTEEECYSDPVTVPTQKWGDVVTPFGGGSQPNFGDVSAVLDKFRSLSGAIPKASADLVGHSPNLIVNFADVSGVLDAFRGIPYPFSGPCVCPPPTTCPMNDACGRCAP
jgi:hypothetical protein